MNKRRYNQDEVSAMCGVTREAIRLWIIEGMPIEDKVGRENQFDPFRFIPWVRENKWLPSLSDRERKLKAEADMAEMEAAKLAGTLLEVSDVQKVWDGHISNCRARLLQIPSKAAVRIDEGMTIGEREGIVREIIHEALDELGGRA